MAAINVSQTKNIQNAINNIKEHFKLFKSKDNTSSEGYYDVGSVKLLQLQCWVEIKLLNTLLHDKWGPMTDAIEGSIDKNIKMLVVVWELVQDNVVRMVSSAQPGHNVPWSEWSRDYNYGLGWSNSTGRAGTNYTDAAHH